MVIAKPHSPGNDDRLRSCRFQQQHFIRTNGERGTRLSGSHITAKTNQSFNFTLWKDAHKLDLTCRVYQIVAPGQGSGLAIQKHDQLHQDIVIVAFVEDFPGPVVDRKNS